VHSTLDDIDWRLLEELQKDGRASIRELARRVHLSPTATTERVRRLESDGAISGYRAIVDPRAAGHKITAFLRLATRAKNFPAAAADLPEIHECHRLTGTDAFLMKVSVPSIERLEEIIDELMVYGEPTTSIVLSTAFSGRLVSRPTGG
jgi:Lrp/AsnC family leucine-responsive transcriptional regulator